MVRDRSRSLSPQRKQALVGDNAAYKCGMCQRPFPPGEWQNWEVVQLRRGDISLVSPTYPDKEKTGRRCVALCDNCRTVEAIGNILNLYF